MPDMNNWGSKLKVERAEVKVTRNENENIVLMRIFMKSDLPFLNQNQNHLMILGLFYKYISPAKASHFAIFVYLSVTYILLTQNWNIVGSSYFFGKM